MTDLLPPAGWLHTFAVAARHAGFAAAAEELHLTPAAVSQQIRALETRLGFQLFERLPRGVRLTEMGRAYLPSVRRAFDDLAAATTGLFGPVGVGLLTVRAPLSFATVRLAPLLPDFRARHGARSIRLCTSVWGDAIDADRVDVDISFGEPGAEPPGSVRLTEPVSVPVAPPGTEFGADPAAVVASLAAASAIQVTGCENLWSRMAAELGVPGGLPTPRIAADTSLMALEMAAAGLGIALVARDLAARHLARGQVVAPPGIALRHELAHYLRLPEGPRAPRADALLFRDWLVGALQADPAAAATV